MDQSVTALSANHGLCRVCLIPSDSSKLICEKLVNEDSALAIIKNYTTLKIEESELLPKHICPTCEKQVIEIYKFSKKFQTSQLHLGSTFTSKNNKINTMINGKGAKNLIGGKQITNGNQNGQAEPPNEDIDIYGDLDENIETDSRREETDVAVETQKYKTVIEEDPLETRQERSKKVGKSKEKMKVDDKTVMCKTCGQIFESNGDYKNHSDKFHNLSRRGLDCSVCKVSVPAQEYKSHFDTHTSEYSCDECNEKFNSSYNLERHCLKTHRSKKKQTPSSTCPICLKKFYSPLNLKRHISNHEKLTSLNDTTVDTVQEFLNICNRTKTLSTQDALDVHKQEHVCKRKLYTNHRLRSHLLRQSKHKQYKCKDCGVKFATRYTLKIHELVHLNPSNSHSCDECALAFSSQHKLLMHKLVHTKVKPYACQICNKKFLTKLSLLLHKKMHSEDGLKYGKRFADNRLRLDHSKVHF